MKKQYAAGTDSGSSCEKMIVTGPEQEALRQDSGPKVDTVIFDIGGVLVELGRFRFLEKKDLPGSWHSGLCRLQCVQRTGYSWI